MVFVPERRPDHDSDTGNGAGYSTGDGADRDIAEGTGSAYGAIGNCRGSVLCPNAYALGALDGLLDGVLGDIRHVSANLGSASDQAPCGVLNGLDDVATHLLGSSDGVLYGVLGRGPKVSAHIT